MNFRTTVKSIILFAFSCSIYAADEQARIIELHAKILANDKTDFIEILNTIENFNVIADPDFSDSLLCASTEIGREYFLENLLITGADPNHQLQNAGNFKQLPLMCAVSRRNLKALRILDAYGANLDAKTNIEMEEKFQRSVLTLTIVSRGYKHADYIMKRTTIDEAEFKAIEYSVNKYDFSEFPEMDALSNKFKSFLASGTTNYAEFSNSYKP